VRAATAGKTTRRGALARTQLEHVHAGRVRLRSRTHGRDAADGDRLGPSLQRPVDRDHLVRHGCLRLAPGYVGMTVGWVEGFELNFFGAVLGFHIRRPALTFPVSDAFGSRPASNPRESPSVHGRRQVAHASSRAHRPTARQPSTDTSPSAAQSSSLEATRALMPESPIEPGTTAHLFMICVIRASAITFVVDIRERGGSSSFRFRSGEAQFIGSCRRRSSRRVWARSAKRTHPAHDARHRYDNGVKSVLVDATAEKGFGRAGVDVGLLAGVVGLPAVSIFSGCDINWNLKNPLESPGNLSDFRNS
jgi:hypothetical protein